MPITSGQLASALPETVGSWDLGPKPRHGKIGVEPEWQQDYVHANPNPSPSPSPNRNSNPDPGPDPNPDQDYVRALLDALRRPADEMARYRHAMKAAARERFSWAAVAALTLALALTLTAPEKSMKTQMKMQPARIEQRVSIREVVRFSGRASEPSGIVPRNSWKMNENQAS